MSHPQISPAQQPESNPIITIISGQIRGTAHESYDRFLGIPYATAPVNSLRFQLPIPVEPWKGIFDAIEYGSTTPQLPIISLPAIFSTADNIRTDDNWLTVNVWAPKKAHNAPVFVWIHGGAYTLGSNAETIYDGDTFARDGVVYVNINYRLGIEGFGAFPDAPANRGIADQILALRWAQENISAFGGDPSNITIGGESAGSMSVGILLTSPHAQGLFHRAIMQSGAPVLSSPQDSAEFLSEIAAELKISPTAHDFSQISPPQLIAAMDKVSRQAKHYQRLLLCSPLIDDDIIPQDPLYTLSTTPAPVPLLIGYNACEAALAVRVLHIFPEITWENFSQMTTELGIAEHIISAYRQYYQPNCAADETFLHLISDMSFVAPIRAIIQQNHHQAYAYIFSWQDPQNNTLSFHLLEIPFMFDHLDTPDGLTLTGDHAPQKLAQEMHAAWVNFIKTGDPGWNTVGERKEYRIFDDPPAEIAGTASDNPLIDTAIYTVIDPRAELLDLWKKV